MFLKKDNTLKWNWIAIGAVITLFLVIAGISGLDKEVYSLIRNPECNYSLFGDGIVCFIAVLFGKIFATKVMFAVSLFSVLFFFMYKAIKNDFDFRYAFVKIKNSYVFYIFASLFTALFTTGFIKFLIGRSRPLLFEALGQIDFRPFTFSSVYNSMPSGHTAASFAVFVMIGMLFPRVKWATWTLSILIALSRIYVGAHWPSDVLLGAFIGMVSADIVKFYLKKINSK